MGRVEAVTMMFDVIDVEAKSVGPTWRVKKNDPSKTKELDGESPRFERTGDFLSGYEGCRAGADSVHRQLSHAQLTVGDAGSEHMRVSIVGGPEGAAYQFTFHPNTFSGLVRAFHSSTQKRGYPMAASVKNLQALMWHMLNCASPGEIREASTCMCQAGKRDGADGCWMCGWMEDAPEETDDDQPPRFHIGYVPQSTRTDTWACVDVVMQYMNTVQKSGMLPFVFYMDTPEGHAGEDRVMDLGNISHSGPESIDATDDGDCQAVAIFILPPPLAHMLPLYRDWLRWVRKAFRSVDIPIVPAVLGTGGDHRPPEHYIQFLRYVPVGSMKNVIDYALLEQCGEKTITSTSPHIPPDIAEPPQPSRARRTTMDANAQPFRTAMEDERVALDTLLRDEWSRGFATGYQLRQRETDDQFHAGFVKGFEQGRRADNVRVQI